jgi:ribonuclease-3
MDYLDLYNQKNFKLIEDKYNICFDDKQLLVKAFIHPSLAPDINNNYQRLEFLGDSILQLVVSDYMYRYMNTKTEGQMSKERAILVSETSLALIIKAEGLHEFLQLGKSILKENTELSDSYIADIYESFVAAIYLDMGYEIAAKFILDTLVNRIEELLSQDTAKDYKTTLQEELQKNGPIKISYQTIKIEEGFKASVYLEDLFIGQGNGKSKKIAEQQAAKNALEVRVD